MDHTPRLCLLTAISLFLLCACVSPVSQQATLSNSALTTNLVQEMASSTPAGMPANPSPMASPTRAPSLIPSPTIHPTRTTHPTQTLQTPAEKTNAPTASSTPQPSPTTLPATGVQPPGEIIYFNDIKTLFMGPADRSEAAIAAYENHHEKMIEMMQGISWSPEGKSIAFAMGPWSDIYIYTLGEPDSLNLTKTGTLFEEYPAWSPNGKLIAFTSDRRQVKGKYTSDIYTMRTDGSAVSLIYECPGRCANLDWSPDGKSIVFQQDKDLYIIPRSGGKAVNLTQGGGVNQYPAWSPDGQWIAFVRSVSLDPPAFIYLVKPDGTGLRALTGKELQPRQLTWSPDGRFIAFENFSDNLGIMILDVQTGETTYWMFGYTPSWRPMDIAALPTPENTPAGVTGNCSSGWSRLQAGSQAQVSGKSGDPPNRVREAASTSAKQVALLYPGTVVSLLEGPVCADGLVFWKVRSDEIPGGSGWTAEGDGAEYWLDPYP